MMLMRVMLLTCLAELQGNYADAISCYNEVLRIDPLAVDGLVNRGNTYKEIGRVNEAIQDYVRAITIRPTMAEAHANLASAYKDRYIFVSFPTDVETSSAITSIPCSYAMLFLKLPGTLYFLCLPINISVEIWICICLISMAYALHPFACATCSGHVEAAIKSYRQALTLRPDFPEATCNLLHTLQVHRNSFSQCSFS